MMELKERCEINDVLKSKYMTTTNSPSAATSTSSAASESAIKHKRNLFDTKTSEKPSIHQRNLAPVSTKQKKRPRIASASPEKNVQDATEEFLNVKDKELKDQVEITAPIPLEPLVEVEAGVLEYNIGDTSEKSFINLTNVEPLTTKQRKRLRLASVSPDNLQELSASVGDNEQVELSEPQQITVEEVSIEKHFENKPQSDDVAVKDVKKHYCPYCRSLYAKFARHIFQVHAGEQEVKSIADLGSKHPERLKILAMLRAKGARIFNTLTTSPSKLILPRRKKAVNLTEYLQCYLCGNTYKSRYLHRHVKKCPNSDGSSRQAMKIAKQQCWKNVEETEDSIKFYEDVVSGMIEGDIKKAILNDETLVQYGKFLCTNYGKERHLINLIRRKLREVTAVFIKMQELDNDILQMEHVFQPTKKKILFDAIKLVTGYDMGVFKRPAMANELSTLLQSCAQRLLVQAQEQEDEEKERKISRWLSIVRSEYNVYIGKHARKTMEENQWNMPKTLPLTADVMKLNLHVKEVCKEATEILSKEFSYPKWSSLNKGTLVKVLLFNRKRVGDVQRMRIEDFEKYHSIQKGSITYEMLSESEKIYCEKYRRVETRGKRGRGVPIILTKVMIEHIKLIISLRDLAEIPSSNRFVFAKQGEQPFPASSSLRELAFECGATSPQLLTGTKLRKEIATATQAFNFSENDLSILAKFMGHTLHTHSHFYRLPDEATQLAKISVVLQAIDSGKIADIKGKSLDELENVVKKLIEDADNSAGQDEQQTSMPPKPTTPKKSKTSIRVSWCTPEKQAMRRYFKHHLRNFTLPNLNECDDARRKNSPLKRRTVMQMKAWVNNENKRVQKGKSKAN